MQNIKKKKVIIIEQRNENMSKFKSTKKRNHVKNVFSMMRVKVVLDEGESKVG
jgi:hypothetical protein